MAVAFVRSHGAEFVKAAGTTDTYATTAIVPAGNLLVMVLVHDNAASANTPTVSSISKPGSETATWVFLGRATYGSAATAGAFANGELWAIKTTVDWPSATSLTVTYSASITMKAQSLVEFSGAEDVTRVTTGAVYSTTTTAANATTTTGPLAGDLAVGFLFGSNAAAAQAGDTDTVGGAWSTPIGVGSTGGSGATNNFGIVQYKILTGAASVAYSNSAAMTAGNGSIAAVLRATPDPVLTQAAYRFYADGTEAGATALEAQNTSLIADVTADLNMQVRVRLQEGNVGNVPATDDFQLQWEKNTSGTWAPVTSFIVADSNLSAQSSYIWLRSGQSMAGQSFTGNGKHLMRGRVLLQKVGAPDGVVTLRLYEHPGTYGTLVTPGALLATSTTSVASASLPAGSWAWYDFDFDGTLTLDNGTPYFICTHTTNSQTTSANAVMFANSVAGSDPGTQATFGASWNPSNSDDYLFEVDTDGASTVAPYASPNLTDGAATTSRLTGGTGTFVAGKVSEDGLVDDLGWAKANHTELLYSVTLKAADTANGDVLRFRVLRNGSTVTYSQTPTLTISEVAGPSYSASPAMSGSGTLGATGVVPSASVSLWSLTPTASDDTSAASGGINVGVKFKVKVAGKITHLRYYEQSATAGTTTLRLFGKYQDVVLATTTHTAVNGASGWRDVALSTPFVTSVNASYAVIVHTAGGNPNFTYGTLSTLQLNTVRTTSGGEIETLQDAQNDTYFLGSWYNGVYAYGAIAGSVPNAFNASNYGADVVFTPGPVTTGNILRRNLWRNPSANLDTQWLSHNAGGAGATVAITRVAPDSSLVVDGRNMSYGRYTYTNAGSGALNQTGPEIGFASDNRLPIDPGDVGKTLAFSAWVRNSQADRTSSLWFRFYTAAGGNLGGAILSAVSLSGWTKMTGTDTVPATAAYLRVVIQAQGGTLIAVNDTVDVGAVLVEISPTVNAYFDGDSTDAVNADYIWDGARGDAQSIVVGEPVTEYSTTAPLSGSGALSATLTPKPVTAAALSGSGTLSSTSIPKPAVAASLSGSGSLGAVVTPKPATAATLSGSGSLGVSAGVSVAGAPVLSGSGTIAAALVPKPTTAPVLAGSGTLTAVGQAATEATATPALTGAGVLAAVGSAAVSGSAAPAIGGAGTLSVLLTPRTAGTATLSGAGVLSTALTAGLTAVAPLSGSGSLAGTTSLALSASTSLSGAGTLGATGSALVAAFTAPVLTGAGSLGTVALPVSTAVATFTGSGALTASVATAGAAAPALSGNGALTAVLTPKPAVAPVLSGAGALSATVATAGAATAAFTGSGTLTPLTTPAWTAVATLSGSGVLASTLVPKPAVLVSFAGGGALAATSAPKPSAVVPFGGSGDLSAAVATAGGGTATLSGAGALATTLLPKPAAGVTLAGAGTLVTQGTPRPAALVPLAGAGTLSAVTLSATSAQVTLGGTGSLTAAVASAGGGTATFFGAGLLLLGAVTPRPVATPALSGAGTLSRTVLPGIAAGPALTGAGALQATVSATARATPVLTGSGLLTSVSSFAPGATAALGGSGTLASVRLPGLAAPVWFAGTGTLSPTTQLTQTAAVSLGGSGLLFATGSGSQAFFGTATLAGAGTLSRTFAPSWDKPGAFSGAGQLTATARTAGGAAPTFAGTGTLTSSVSFEITRVTVLSGGSQLQVFQLPGYLAEVAFTGDGVLTYTEYQGLPLDVDFISMTGSPMIVSTRTVRVDAVFTQRRKIVLIAPTVRVVSVTTKEEV